MENTTAFGVMMLKRCETVGVFRSLKEQISLLQCKSFDVQNSTEATALIRAQWRGVVFGVVEDRDSLTQAITLLTENHPAVRARQIRVIVFNKIANDKVASLLMKKGCVEVLQQEPNIKALVHKTRQNLKITDQAGKASVSAEPREPAPEDTHNEAENHDAPVISTVRPLESTADFWLLWKKSDARRIMGRWIIDLVGPGPSTGLWEQDQSSAWRWRARVPSSPFNVEGAHWVFSGRKPEFDWKKNAWNFVSDSPSLQLHFESGSAPQFRFRLKDSNTLEITSNSKSALELLSTIQQTFQRDYTVTADPSKGAKNGDLQGPAEDSSTPAWNQGDLSKNEDAVDWNDHGATRQTIFNNGRGLTQGMKSEKGEDEENADFHSAADAFKPIHVNVQINGTPAELIERGSDSMKLALPEALALPGNSVKLELSTTGYGNPSRVIMDCAIETVEEDKMDDGSRVCSIRVSKQDSALLEKLWTEVEVRQTDILTFLKAAKGF